MPKRLKPDLRRLILIFFIFGFLLPIVDLSSYYVLLYRREVYNLLLLFTALINLWMVLSVLTRNSFYKEKYLKTLMIVSFLATTVLCVGQLVKLPLFFYILEPITWQTKLIFLKSLLHFLTPFIMFTVTLYLKTHWVFEPDVKKDKLDGRYPFINKKIIVLIILAMIIIIPFIFID